MLAYRHSFHAGNHADVLKHLVLMAVLAYFRDKDKPYWVIDTHAGAGLYALDGKHAQTNAEHLDGIARLWRRDDLPPLVQDYVTRVAELALAAGSPEGKALTRYPGSPALAASMLQAGDKLKLYELHPSDFTLLRGHFGGRREVSMHQGDGFAGLKASLPPPPRRGVVLIDPSYELKDDYRHVFDAVKDSLLRFSQGTYLIWYPVLRRPEWQRLKERLERLEVKWLNVVMRVTQPDDEGFGMQGSGMFVINPPWVLEGQLREVMPWLTERLAQYPGAEFQLRSFEPKLSRG